MPGMAALVAERQRGGRDNRPSRHHPACGSAPGGSRAGSTRRSLA